MIDWCLTPILAVFQLYRGQKTCTNRLKISENVREQISFQERLGLYFHLTTQQK